MRMAADGRADRQQETSSRRDAYERTASKPLPDRDYGQAKHGAPIQLKAEIALKARPGDDREAAGGVSKQATQASTSHVDNSFGRAKPQAPVPLKAEITIKMHQGDNRDTSDTKKAPANAAARDRSGRTGAQANGLKTPLSREDKMALCKQTGVCIPMLMASDDSDDKTM